MKLLQLLLFLCWLLSPTTSFATRRRPPETPRTRHTSSVVKNPLEAFSNSFTQLGSKGAEKGTEEATKSPEKRKNNASSPSSTLPFLKTLGLGVFEEEDEPFNPRAPPLSSDMAPNDIESPDSSNKFDMVQRLESVKCAVIGALSGSIAVVPVTFLHYAATSLSQWELATDMAAAQGALFAIVYRYAIRNDDNPMLNEGVLGAFVIVRTLPTIQASPECTAIPLSCK